MPINDLFFILIENFSLLRLCSKKILILHLSILTLPHPPSTQTISIISKFLGSYSSERYCDQFSKCVHSNVSQHLNWGAIVVIWQLRRPVHVRAYSHVSPCSRCRVIPTYYLYQERSGPASSCHLHSAPSTVPGSQQRLHWQRFLNAQMSELT